MEEKHDTGLSLDDRPNPSMLFCEQHGWTGVMEGMCYGSVSCKDAAVCVMASNFEGRREGKK
jgi:hypothetical protein